jgi:hypothetical protein
MKLVREHIIFEKFIEDSDPIEDMGIGIIKKLDVFLILKQNNVCFMSHELNILKTYFEDDLSKVYLLSEPYFRGDKKDDFSIFCKRTIHKIISKLKIYKRTFVNSYYYDLYQTSIGKICNLHLSENEEYYFLSDLSAAVNLYGQYLKK